MRDLCGGGCANGKGCLRRSLFRSSSLGELLSLSLSLLATRAAWAAWAVFLSEADWSFGWGTGPDPAERPRKTQEDRQSEDQLLMARAKQITELKA